MLLTRANLELAKLASDSPSRFMKALRRFWFGHVFYRLPRRARIVGYISLRDRMLIGPFGVIYQTYEFHRWNTPVLGRERFVGLRILDQ